MKKMILVGIGITAVAGVALAASSDVSLEVTKTDMEAVASVPQLRKLTSAPRRTLRDEVDIVLAVQDSILSAAPLDKGIPEGQSREVADLLQARQGLCYDRSRAIETSLRSLGFETRHASIYSTAKTGSALRALATPGVDSHAVTEVKTRAGWMLVDSNQRWIGLAADGRPVDLARLRQDRVRAWSKMVNEPHPVIYNGDFTWAYGLYSRHGQFYAPYNAIPDINWSEMIQNI